MYATGATSLEIGLYEGVIKLLLKQLRELSCFVSYKLLENTFTHLKPANFRALLFYIEE
jgi:hypothetical protein